MYVHREQRVVYYGHEQTASRETGRALRRRGFDRIGGHHGFPWEWTDLDKVRARADWPGIFWWLEQDPSDYECYATVRSPFDIFHTRVCRQEMYVHDRLKLCYIAHPRTASRETAEALKRRGFVQRFGHHGVPWGPGWLGDGNRAKEGDIWWWWNQPANEYGFYATARNHFDLFLSFCTMYGVETQEEIMHRLWLHAATYRNGCVLFPAFHEVPGCRVLRFETLRDDLSAMLEEHHLRPLADDEFRREKSDTQTVGKPEGGYRGNLSDALVEWISERYAVEMKRFGYTY